MPTLVAMARSGETFITRDPLHGLWLHLPEGAAGAGPIDDASVERAVADHGFVPVEEEFDTWQELDDFRQARVALVTPVEVVDRAELDRDDIAEMLGVAKRWTANGEGHRSHRLALELLEVPVVLRDVVLHGEIVSLLKELIESGVDERLRRQPDDPQQAEARRIWQTLTPAA